jgi:hypothetical protein
MTLNARIDTAKVYTSVRKGIRDNHNFFHKLASQEGIKDTVILRDPITLDVPPELEAGLL